MPLLIPFSREVHNGSQISVTPLHWVLTPTLTKTKRLHCRGEDVGEMEKKLGSNVTRIFTRIARGCLLGRR